MLSKRLSRIEGQVRGLSKMADEGRCCIDIVTQISAGSGRAPARRERGAPGSGAALCRTRHYRRNKADQRAKIAEQD
jgi:hypothetical protein